ncbi:hypothetical protein ACVWYN_002023 [Pedobacter sp. UYP24]
MKNIQKIKTAMVLVALITLPFLIQAQEIRIEGGNVKVKTAGTVIEAKNGNVGVSTGSSSKATKNQVKVGVKNIVGNDIKQQMVCNGGDVVITGNDNAIVIIGYLNSLKITGSDNNVRVEKVTSIKTFGNDNQITYKTSPNKNGLAVVSTTGSDNEISKQ